MPVVLALLLAIKAAHTKHESNDIANNNSTNSSTTSDGFQTITKRRTKMKLEKRGAYMLDVKNGLLMLPPECERPHNESQHDKRHVNESSHNNATSDDDESDTNKNDNPTKSNDHTLSTREISSTIMGIPSTIVDLDDTLSDGDVNTSMETVTLTDVNGNHHGSSSPGNLSPADVRNDSKNNSGIQHHNATTFRKDVRDEWVDAMFGRDFFPTRRGTGPSSSTNRDDNHWKDLSVKQGTGGANVGNWVTYGALLDATNPNNHGNNNNSNNIDSSMKTPQKESALATLLKTKSTPLMTTNSVSNQSFGESLINVRSGSNFQNHDNNAGHHAADTNNNSRQTSKIGATISRIPLGIYVRSISLTSEAYTVGISPGSILIDINGLGLLGETSYRAVERLWHYAGDYVGEMGNGSTDNLQVKKPIQLRFFKNSQVYTVFLMSSTPLKGIEWAPCGNFALVQRSSGLAAQCGVRRGCLVLAVNDIGMRQLDHAGVAKALIENYAGGSNSVVLTCGYTPATSRSGYYEEKTVEKKSGGGNSSSAGVEVRPRPVEYSTALSETFFACTAPSVALVDDGVMQTTPPNSAFKSSIVSSVRSSTNRGGDGENLVASELAAYVATGEILPTDLGAVASQLEMYESSQQQRRRLTGIGSFGPCPSIRGDSLLDAWNPLVSLSQSMSYQATGCCETSYMGMGGPFRIAWGNESYGKEAAHTMSECIRVISGIAQHPTPGVAENVFDTHSMQLLGVATRARLDSGNDTVNLSKKLLDILVDVALNDISLCQKLFFLIRCFIGALDDQVSDGSAQSLKLLRHAQRRLSGKIFDQSECQETNRHSSEGCLMSIEKSSTSSFGKVAQLDIALSESCSSENRQVVTPGAPANRQRHDNENRNQEANNGASSLRLESSTSGDCLSTDGLSCQTPASTMTANSNGGIKKKIKSSAKIRQLFKGGKSKSSMRDSQLPSTGLARSFKQGSTFSFTNVFHKQPASLRLNGDSPSSQTAVMNLSMSQQFENLAWILRRIDATCSEIEKKLIKSFPQKMANLALKPWSASKESALASITLSFQAELRAMNSDSDSESHFPILNPIDSSEQLTSVDADECFILPSAHFPMLLCFNTSILPSSPQNSALVSDKEGHFNCLYRTKIEIIGLSSTMSLSHKANGNGEAYIVQGAVGGIVQESGTSELYVNPTRASKRGVMSHRWTKNNTLSFESSSNFGLPKTLSLKISTVSRNVDSRDDANDDMGCAFIDLTSIWKQINQKSNDSPIDASARVFLFDECGDLFDQHGEAEMHNDGEEVEIQIKVTVEVVPAELYPQKRLLLFKHGDDLRQELLAIQFIEMCNQILKSSGLDLKLKTFRCLPVEAQKGFIEWVSGTVPLSQLCRSTYLTESNVGSRQSSKSTLDDSEHSLPANEMMDSVETSAQGRSWCKYQAIRGLGQISNAVENPIQDFLRAAAYDKFSPYYVKKEVMDTYVKSCAGYCVITYLLGVGDRHLDNILLHQNGHLLHCDFSFILGHDPKTYLPMRITDEMIRGFGGQESDNYAKFISFIGAAFLTLRRHNNLHSLLSQIRNMIYSNLRDLSFAQPPIEAILVMKDRFQLDLSDDEALSYMEHVVEKSINSKMWRAVDAMHSLGKHF